MDQGDTAEAAQDWVWCEATRTRALRLVEVCAHCGIPCSGTALFWHAGGDQRVLVEVDRPTVWELFEKVSPPADYGAMPAIWRDSNEGQGWCSVPPSPGTPYEAQDLAALVAMLRGKVSDDSHVRVLDALDALAASAQAAATCVLLRED